MAINYVKVVVDEIALEGLHGITLQALWARLENRREGKMVIDLPMKEFLWKLIPNLTAVDMYLLPVARADMILPKFPDPERDIEDILFDVMHHMKSLYPHCPVEDAEDRGSCDTYYHRVNAPQELPTLSLKQCEEMYGNRLVLVANQETRGRALAGSSPYWMEMSKQHYSILEAIGRLRHFGMYSNGPASLQDISGIDPRTMFYIRKGLMQHNLMTKQLHIVRSHSTMCRTFLLHLTRFFSIVKSNVVLKQEKVLNALLGHPEQRMVYSDLREACEMEALPFKKMTAAMQNNGVIEFLQNVPFREMYPHAQSSEYQKKDGSEKMVRVVVLKRDTLEEQKPEEEEDDEDEDNKDLPGLLDQSNQTLDRTLLHQAYHAIEMAGSEGLAQRQVGKILGLSKLDSRLVCRQLVKEGFVSSHMIDAGKTKTSMFRAIRLQHKDYKLAAEKEKFVALSGSPDMLDAFMCTGKRREPRNFVLKSLSAHATDVSRSAAGHSIHISEMDNALTAFPDFEPSDDDSVVTFRMLKRANLLLEMVTKQKVIYDFCLIQRMISEAEALEGYHFKIDRKSMYRLIAKLRLAKCLKLYKAVIRTGHSNKTITFVCSNEIKTDNPIIHSIIGQAQLRISVDRVVESNEVEEEVASSVSKLKNLQKKSEKVSNKWPQNLKNAYGLCPRFIRMKILHELLFYMVWDYTGTPSMDQVQAQEEFVSQNYYGIPDDCPVIFRPASLDFRTFIPPLPVHEGWANGWVLLADLILRIPIAVFLRLVRQRFLVPGLAELLADPIRKNYLLVHLPKEMRDNLLGGSRKFLFSIFEIVQKLCFVGLVQFGPQVGKEKDQMFFYVNRRALIFDTTITPPAYFKVDPSLIYSRQLHFLGNLTDVGTYWSEVYKTCMRTRLGLRLPELGHEIVVEAADSKHILLESCVVRGAEEAPELDLGIMPGDQLGAAGLDSAMFAHLKRNWQSKGMPKEHRFTLLVDPKQQKAAKREVVRVEVKPKPKASAMRITQRKARIMKRVLKRRVHRKVRKNHFETFRHRAKWTNEEDFILVLCKVASIYFMKNELFPRLPVEKSTLSKIMHKYVPHSQKSPVQCLRRMKSLYSKLEHSQGLIALFLDEAYQSPNIHSRFSDFKAKIVATNCSSSDYELLFQRGFEEFVGMLKEIEKQVTSSTAPRKYICLADSVEEFQQKFSIVSSLTSATKKAYFSDPSSEEQIQNHTIISMFMSILCLGADRNSYYKLITYIFQQYPDSLLRAAIAWMRSTGLVISTKKRIVVKSKLVPLPLESSALCFSFSYIHLLTSKVPFEVLQESWSVLKKLDSDNWFTYKDQKVLGGHVSVLLEGLAAGLITASIDTSGQIISIEFDSDISPVEKNALDKAFRRVDRCQKQLDCFQETEESEEMSSPPKRQKFSGLLMHGSVSELSDNEDEDATSPVEERHLSAKEKVIKDNVEARLAFYAKREELHNQRSVNEKRDRRARLTIAPCPVHCIKVRRFPLDQEDIQTYLNNIKREALPTSDFPDLKTALQSYYGMDVSETDIFIAIQLIQMISDTKTSGLSLENLRANFEQGSGQLSLSDHLGLLTSIGVVVRVGVTTFHYVHSAFKVPWLINSKVEKDSTDSEQVFVAVRPWIRVDGSINKKALDTFLSSILLSVLSAPGCTMEKLSSTPALRPCHVYELVEILSCLGCITATVVHTAGASDLFAEPSFVSIEPANFTELEDAIALEPTVDALTRISLFIGEKNYASTLIEDIRFSAQQSSVSKDEIDKTNQ